MIHRPGQQLSFGERMPDPRGQAVLSVIIEKHQVTGDPIGSNTISKSFAHTTGWSSATIRNVMVELEESGLIEQPHTSAGRVPTDKGYRFYVDHMIGNARLSKTDLAAIDKMLGISGADGVNIAPDRLMERISHLLSEVSENVGIVVSPSFADARLQHIEFLRLAENRILVVMVSAPNIIQNKIIHVDEDFTQDVLEQTARYLSAEFSGKSLSAIRAEILDLMNAERALYDTLLRSAIFLCERSLEGEEIGTGGDVYVDGASNILAKPDFADAQRLRELFRTLEEKTRLVKILNECLTREHPMSRDVQVVIGREHVAPSMRDCALITTSYRIGAQSVGTLGVVGPVRIEYARIMAVVNYVARLMERMLHEEPAAD